jgi:hypothetical protein
MQRRAYGVLSAVVLSLLLVWTAAGSSVEQHRVSGPAYAGGPTVVLPVPVATVWAIGEARGQLRSSASHVGWPLPAVVAFVVVGVLGRSRWWGTSAPGSSPLASAWGWARWGRAPPGAGRR